MPYITHRSVFKRIRQNTKHRERNRVVRGTMRAVMRAITNQKALDSVLGKLAWELNAKTDEEKIKQASARMYSIIDKALKKGVIHKNKASRHKSQIALWTNQLIQKTAS